VATKVSLFTPPAAQQLPSQALTYFLNLKGLVCEITYCDCVGVAMEEKNLLGTSNSQMQVFEPLK
jgi:hypothetical protein